MRPRARPRYRPSVSATPSPATPAPDLLARLAARLVAGHLRPEDVRDDAVPPRIGRYAVLRPLGRGAGGRVFLAQDPTLGRQVAVKLLAALGPSSQERFRREMQVLARFEHPGIVRIYDAGMSEDGPYFVMEYVDQPSLADARLSLPQAVETLEAVARACQAAHDEGIVHRDLKPSNILVGPRPVVLDFGVARVLDEEASHGRTRVGTPEYMAPEQAAGEPVGPWTDVHALGVLLYEQLAGRTPFQGEDLVSVLREVCDHVPVPPPDAPPALAALAQLALSKRPRARPSAAAFADALAHWREAPSARPAASGGLIAGAVLGVCALAATPLALSRMYPGPPPPPPREAPAISPPPASQARPLRAPPPASQGQPDPDVRDPGRPQRDGRGPRDDRWREDDPWRGDDRWRRDRPRRDDDRPPRGGRPPRDDGRPPRDDGRPPRDDGRPPRDDGRPPRDDGRPPRDDWRDDQFPHPPGPPPPRRQEDDREPPPPPPRPGGGGL
ncbi:MAG: protein kinase [Planctomycetota bacterium]